MTDNTPQDKQTDSSSDKPNSKGSKENSNQETNGDGGSDQKNGSDKSNDPNRPMQPPNNIKFTRGLLMWMMLLMVLLVVFVVFSQKQAPQVVNLYQLQDIYQAEFIEEGSVVIKPSAIYATVRDGYTGGVKPGPVQVKIGPAGYEFYFNKVDEFTGSNFKDETSQPMWISLMIGLVPWILIIFIIWFFFFRSIRNAGGGAGMFGNFGRSKHRVSNKEHTNVTFADVAGIDEAKEELEEIVQFLKSPKRFQRLGGRIPRGVLLNGPPGCGKTLLAKAIAGEADVPFFSISGSDFVEMFVGVGASRVRDLFKQAKEGSPCIIFLDEIDAVGRKRGGGFASGGNDEREQTLNAILVEMDGFESNDQVIVIAATNRQDVLDPALTRPGRFDRQVNVPLPDLKGRHEILKVHARSVKLSPQVQLDRMARGTPMFSGADLAALINEAAIIATLGNKDFVEQEDLEEARDKIKFGRARKSHRLEEMEKCATAYHEAGHAVIQALLEDADPLHKVTIIPRGNYGGATFSLPEKDRYGFGLKYLTATMRVLCAGRIAEERATEDISSGASQDIRQVTAFARMMVLEWGMSDRLGFVRYGQEDGNESFINERTYSDDTAKIIDEEIKKLADISYEDCTRMLNENWDKVIAVADGLMKYETLTADEVHRLMRGDTLSRETVAGLLDSERGKKDPTATATGEAAADDTSVSGEEPDTTDSGGIMPTPA